METPVSIIIDGFGKIDLVDGEVKGYGQLWLLNPNAHRGRYRRLWAYS